MHPTTDHSNFELEWSGVVWLKSLSLRALVVGMVGYPSGQRGQTVNLLAHAFAGSNPAPTTTPIAKHNCPCGTVARVGTSKACFTREVCMPISSLDVKRPNEPVRSSDTTPCLSARRGTTH